MSPATPATVASAELEAKKPSSTVGQDERPGNETKVARTADAIPKTIPDAIPIPQFKCVLVGDGAVGKTAFLHRFLGENFRKQYVATLGVEVHRVTIPTSRGPVQFNVWDTAGQEKFGGLRDGYYVNGDCAIVMFDVTARATLKHASNWTRDVQRVCGPDVPLICVGNKIDGNRRCSHPCSFTQHSGGYCEISTKTNANITAPFERLATMIAVVAGHVLLHQPVIWNSVSSATSDGPTATTTTAANAAFWSKAKARLAEQRAAALEKLKKRIAAEKIEAEEKRQQVAKQEEMERVQAATRHEAFKEWIHNVKMDPENTSKSSNALFLEWTQKVGKFRPVFDTRADEFMRQNYLTDYCEAFFQNGFDTFDKISRMSKADLAACGISKPGHVKRATAANYKPRPMLPYIPGRAPRIRIDENTIPSRDWRSSMSEQKLWVKNWLAKAAMTTATVAKFFDLGYDTHSSVITMSRQDLVQCGVTKPVACARAMAAVKRELHITREDHWNYESKYNRDIKYCPSKVESLAAPPSEEDIEIFNGAALSAYLDVQGSLSSDSELIPRLYLPGLEQTLCTTNDTWDVESVQHKAMKRTVLCAFNLNPSCIPALQNLQHVGFLSTRSFFQRVMGFAGYIPPVSHVFKINEGTSQARHLLAIAGACRYRARCSVFGDGMRKVQKSIHPEVECSLDATIVMEDWLVSVLRSVAELAAKHIAGVAAFGEEKGGEEKGGEEKGGEEKGGEEKGGDKEKVDKEKLDKEKLDKEKLDKEKGDKEKGGKSACTASTTAASIIASRGCGTEYFVVEMDSGQDGGDFTVPDKEIPSEADSVIVCFAGISETASTKICFAGTWDTDERIVARMGEVGTAMLQKWHNVAAEFKKNVIPGTVALLNAPVKQFMKIPYHHNFHAIQKAVKKILTGEIGRYALSEAANALTNVRTGEGKKDGSTTTTTTSSTSTHFSSLHLEQVRRQLLPTGFCTDDLTCVHFAAMLEYLHAELMELAGNCARDDGCKSILPRHIELAVSADEELSEMWRGFHVLGGGATRNIYTRKSKYYSPLRWKKHLHTTKPLQLSSVAPECFVYQASDKDGTSFKQCARRLTARAGAIAISDAALSELEILGKGYLEFVLQKSVALARDENSVTARHVNEMLRQNGRPVVLGLGSEAVLHFDRDENSGPAHASAQAACAALAESRRASDEAHSKYDVTKWSNKLTDSGVELGAASIGQQPFHSVGLQRVRDILLMGHDEGGDGDNDDVWLGKESVCALHTDLTSALYTHATHMVCDMQRSTMPCFPRDAIVTACHDCLGAEELSVAWSHSGIAAAGAAYERYLLEILEEAVLNLPTGSDSEDNETGFSIGQQVECRDSGNEEWRLGVVERVNPLRVMVESYLRVAVSWDEVRASRARAPSEGNLEEKIVPTRRYTVEPADIAASVKKLELN